MGLLGELFGKKKPEEIIISQAAFKQAALLIKLLHEAGSTQNNTELLRSSCFAWMHSENRELKSIGLDVARLLFKSKNIPYSKTFLDQVLQIFFNESSHAVKLAALGLLGAMQTSPNPMDHLPKSEAQRFREFWLQAQKSDGELRRYRETGVHSDLRVELANKSPQDAFVAAIERVAKLH